MFGKIKNKINSDEHLKELLSGSTVTFGIKVTGMLIGYIVTLLISRKFGAEGMGVYSLTSRLLNSLAILGALGMNISVLRYVGEFAQRDNAPAWLEQLYRSIATLTFPFSLLVGVVLFIFAEKIALNLFDNPVYTPALKISAFALPFFTLNLINVEFIRGLKLLKVSEYLRSINGKAVIIILLFFSVFSHGMLDPVYALVAGLLLTFLFSMGFILNYFRKHKFKPLSEKGLTKKELTKTSFPMMTTAAASFILANAGGIFLEVYSTTDQVGIFNVALSLSTLVSLVLVVVNTISAPKFSELYWAGEKKELQKMITQSTKLIFFVSLVISIGLVVFSQWVLDIFGEEFAKGSVVLIILVLGQMINAASGSVGIFLNMTGNEKIMRTIIVIAVSVVLVGYVVIVPFYGMTGAAIVFMIGGVVVNLSAVIYSYKKLNVRTFYLPFFN